jgi:hypothetical protein
MNKTKSAVLWFDVILHRFGEMLTLALSAKRVVASFLALGFVQIYRNLAHQSGSSSRLLLVAE